MDKNKEWGKADWSKVTTQVANEYGCFVGMADVNKFVSYNCRIVSQKTGESYQDVANAVKERNEKFFNEIEKFFKEFDGFSKGSEEFKNLQKLFEVPLMA